MQSQQRNMLNVEKWAQDKCWLIATLAPQIATSAQDLHLGFAQIKRRRIFNHQLPLPPLPAWFSLYRSHRKPICFFKEMFKKFFPSGPFTIDVAESFTEGLRLLSRGNTNQETITLTPDVLTKTRKILDKIREASFTDLANDFSGKAVSPLQRDKFIDLLERRHLESSFFILVHTPCWLLYRTSPTRLYRKARNGNVDALSKLLNLDPLMIHDPLIGRQIHRIRYQGKPKTYSKLMEAPLKKLKVKIDSRRMKYAAAGLISAIAHVINQRLTERDIHDLFDTVAKDVTGNAHAVDLDLIVSPETFAKAIYRERQFWISAMKSDKRI